MALFSLNVGDITPSLWLVAAPVLISVLQQGKKLIYWDIVIFTFLFTICALPTILTICGNDALSALVNSLYNMVDYPQGSQLWYYLRSSKIMAIFTIFVLVCYAVHYRDKLHKIRLEELYEQLTRNNDNELIKRIKTIADEDDDDESKRYDKLYNRIVEYMEMNRPFTKKDFSAAQLSIALNINASYLSLAINAKRNMNFNTFVNTYRIENVKKMIRFNSKKYTLEHIYLSSGFKNQSTFNKAFKQYEGITPTEYIKKLNDNSMISEFQ
jgi:YesN/AraC family two-component response regulator